MPRAAGGVRVGETPFGNEVRVEGREVVLSRLRRADGRPAIGTDLVVVVLEQNRVGPIVREHGRSDVPAEVVGGERNAGRAEFEKMSPQVVVARRRAEKNRPVGQNHRGSRRKIRHATRRPLVRRRIDAAIGARPTTSRRPARRH